MTKKINNQKIPTRFNSLDHDVKQIILGTLLGDGLLVKNSKNAEFRCSHNSKQKNYIFWKKEKLSKYFRVKVNLRNNGPKYKIYQLYTNCSPIFTELHPQFYIKSNKPNRRWEKIINFEIVKQLTPLGLAVWYCDDGTYTVRDKSCNLATHCFSLKENSLIKNIFQKNFGVNSCIRKEFRKSNNKTYYFLFFNTKETMKFLNLIKNHVHESMIYKLGHISEKNAILMKKEDLRYKLIAKKWYYENHDRALKRAKRYNTRKSLRDEFMDC